MTLVVAHREVQGGRDRAGGHDPGDRVPRGEVGRGRRGVPRGAAPRDSCRAVQAAEHVEQRRGLRGRGRDRAGAVGAGASGRRPAADDLSPVLLKPQMDRGSRVVVRGRPVGMLDASDYRAGRARLMNGVMASFARLVAEFDLVIVEGAGSPGEVNLRAGEIANMGFARRAEVPACLVGDIDRGGVIAAVVGTGAVLEAADRALIAGFLKQAARQPGTVRGRGPHHRAPHRLALLRRDSMGAGGAAPAG